MPKKRVGVLLLVPSNSRPSLDLTLQQGLRMQAKQSAKAVVFLPSWEGKRRQGQHCSKRKPATVLCLQQRAIT